MEDKFELIENPHKETSLVDLQDELAYLKELRSSLADKGNKKSTPPIKKVENEDLQTDLGDLNSIITEKENLLKETAKKLDESYARLETITEERERALNKGNLLSEDEIERIKHDSFIKSVAERNIFIKLHRQMTQLREEINALEEQKEHTNESVEEKEQDVQSTITALYYPIQQLYYMGSEETTVGQDDLENIKDNAESAPKKIVGEKATNYVPGNAPADLENVSEVGIIDKFVIYNDKDENKYYVRKATVERFMLEPLSDDVNIEGSLWNQISEDDVQKLLANQHNDLSPYVIEERELAKENENTQKDTSSNEDGVEHFDIYMTSSGEYYVTQDALNRFLLKPIGDEVIVDGVSYFQISEEDVKDIKENQNSGFVSYNVSEKEIAIKKEEQKDKENKALHKVSIYKDSNNNYYLEKSALESLSLKPSGEDVVIDGKIYSHIDENTAKAMINFQNNGLYPFEVDKKDLAISKEEEVVVEESTYKDDSFDKVIIYKNSDNKIYLDKKVMEHFKLKPSGEDVVIDGKVCSEIDENTAKAVAYYQNNEYFPYKVEEKEVSLSNIDEATASKNVVTEAFDTHEDSNKQVVVKRKQKPNDFREKISVYRDLNHDDTLYVRKNVLERFMLEPIGDEAFINNASFYPVKKEAVDGLFNNADNQYSPYVIDIADVRLNDEDIGQINKSNNSSNQIQDGSNGSNDQAQDGSNGSSDQAQEEAGNLSNQIQDDSNDSNDQAQDGSNGSSDQAQEEAGNLSNQIGEVSDDTSDQAQEESDDLTDQIEEVSDNTSDQTQEEEPYGEEEIIDVYRVLDENDQLYVPKNYVDLFDLGYIGDEKKIQGVVCLPITESDEKILLEAQLNRNPRYRLNYTNVQLHEEDTRDDVYITYYRDLNDNNKLYLDLDDHLKLDLVAVKNPVLIDGIECFPIEHYAYERNRVYMKNHSKEHNYIVQIKDVRLNNKVGHMVDEETKDQKPRPHVHYVLNKITSGILKPDEKFTSLDVDNFKIKNAKCSSVFFNELKSDRVSYRVAAVAPAIFKTSITFLRKLGAKLLLTSRKSEIINAVHRRLDDLTDEELDVLFDEYKGQLLKTTKLDAFNDILIDKLRNHGLKKVNNYNTKIRDSYAKLFTCLARIKELDKLISAAKRADQLSLLGQRASLYEEAAGYVRVIEESRKEANKLLSSGVHGIEEDFKAVRTGLIYQGAHSAVKHKYDEKLRKQLSDYGQKLNDALLTNEAEKIVSNFMNLETLYYKNTKIEKSILGTKSTGKLYYSPVAEVFDYRDDPFIRNVITTLTLGAAALSVGSAIKTHVLDSRDILLAQKAQADRLNKANEAVMDQVNNIGSEFEGKRDVFLNGMKAQNYETTASIATFLERKGLDLRGWIMDSKYNNIDKGHHDFYNQFHEQVTAQISDIASRYGTGSISQAEALKEMAKVTNNSHNTLVNLTTDCFSVLKEYEATHPQFNLKALHESFEYIVAHSDDFNNMNKAMVSITDLGTVLKGLNVEQVEALTSLPSDMLQTILSAAGAASLAAYVSKTAKNPVKTDAKYKEEIEKMLGDYTDGNSSENENTRTK